MVGYDVESSGSYFPSGMPSRGWRNLCVSYLAVKRITQSLLHSARGARWLWRACVRGPVTLTQFFFPLLVLCTSAAHAPGSFNTTCSKLSQPRSIGGDEMG